MARAPQSVPRLVPAPASEPNRRSRRWIYERYDHLVGSRTVRRPGLDAAVLRLRPSFRGLAVSLDGPPPGLRDLRLAGLLATLESARNVACAGGEPIGLTDCLNFGNPEKAAIGGSSPRRSKDRRGGRGARHPCRLGQRLALQRVGRAGDPAHAGRRLRRPRPRRSPRFARLARRRRGPARDLSGALDVEAALWARLACRAGPLARARRRRGRPLARARRGGRLERPAGRDGPRRRAGRGELGRAGVPAGEGPQLEFPTLVEIGAVAG